MYDNTQGIFKLVKKDLTKEMLTNLTRENWNDFFELTVKQIKSYDELKVELEKYDLDISKVYFTDNHLYGTWYIDGPAFVNLQNLFALDMFCKGTNQYRDHLLKMEENEEWEDLIFGINDIFALGYFIDNYKRMSKDVAAQVLCHLYTSREYALNLIDISIIEEIFNGFGVSQIKSRGKDYVTIYRGQTYASTPLQDALSWSTSKKKATWFANRFQSGGTIYKGKVKLSDIMMYTNDRDEFEVLVRFENVYDVEKV